MKEINRHILIEVIKSLKEKTLKNDVWDDIKKNLELNEASNEMRADTLKSSIKTLPSRIAKEEIWENIALILDEEEKNEEDHQLQKVIQDLPKYNAPPGLFEEIIPDPKVKPKVRYINKIYYIASSIAAAILLAFGIIFLKEDIPVKTEEVTISYSEEENDDPNNVLQFINENEHKDEVLAFVKENCVNIEVSCENPKFKGLLSHYIELESAHEELVQEIKMNEEQHQLVNYLVRIEKEKTQIGKQLIQLLIS